MNLIKYNDNFFYYCTVLTVQQKMNEDGWWMEYVLKHDKIWQNFSYQPLPEFNTLITLFQSLRRERCESDVKKRKVKKKKEGVW